MVDVSKVKSELSSCIRHVVKWLEENEFDAKITVYNTNKTVFEVSKNGVNDKLEISASREKIESIEKYLMFFAESFNRKCENEKLKRELKEKGIL